MTPSEIYHERILLSPLNWGMGHVSRCIGLIAQLKSQENVIYLACSADQREVFEQYFDDLNYLEHAGYPFLFRGKGRFGFDLASKSLSLFKRLRNERRETENFVFEHNIDLVLSDHRYGFRSEKVTSIIITHQINLPVRWHEVLINLLHKKYLSKFKRIWVMDDADSRLSGKLSTSKRTNVDFIGPYSRFSLYPNRPEKDVERVLIASGPTVYAQQLVEHVVKSNPCDLMVIYNEGVTLPAGVRGICGDWRKQDAVILRAKHLISRAGYSTIMDCEELKISRTLIATPGQSEQEYLCERHREG